MILGATGRNIGAGMSGGYAFVLDLDESVVNREMVDFGGLPDDQHERLREIVSTHVGYTGSAVGTALLDDWDAALARFSAIIPRDFQRVLDATKRAEDAGEDVDEAVMAAARASEGSCLASSRTGVVAFSADFATAPCGKTMSDRTTAAKP